jgi:WD40 repeat protein
MNTAARALPGVSPVRHLRQAVRAKALLAVFLAATAALPGGAARGAPVRPAADPDRSTRLPVAEEPLPEGAVARLGTGRLRHSNWISSLAFSPDGKLLASGGGDGLIRFWDAATGAPRQVLSDLTGRVAEVAFRPDGATLASTEWHSETPSIRLWDVNTGAERLRCRRDGGLHNIGGGPVVFSPDGKTLASAEEMGQVVLWDAVTGKKIAELGRHDGTISCYPHVRQVAFAPDGRTLASCGWDGAVRLWDTLRHQPLRVLRSADTAVSAIAFTPDGRRLVSGGGVRVPEDPNDPVKDGAIRVWDVASGNQLFSLRDPDTRIGFFSLALSPDGRTLAASSGGVSRLWDLTEGKPLRPLGGRRNRSWWVHSLAFSPDGKTLAGASHNAIALWETATGRLLTPTPEETNGGISSVVLSQDGRLLAVADEVGTVGLWDFPSRRMVHRLYGHQYRLYHVAISPDAKTVATAAEDGTVRTWDAATGRESLRLSGTPREDYRPDRIAFSPDGKLLASTYHYNLIQGGPRGIRLLDAASGKELQNLEIGNAYPNWLVTVAFTPDGRALTGTTQEGQTYRWRLDGGRFVGGAPWEGLP